MGESKDQASSWQLSENPPQTLKMRSGRTFTHCAWGPEFSTQFWGGCCQSLTFAHLGYNQWLSERPAIALVTTGYGWGSSVPSRLTPKTKRYAAISSARSAQGILVIHHLRVYNIEHLKNVLVTILGFSSDQECVPFVRNHRKDNILCLYSVKVRMHWQLVGVRAGLPTMENLSYLEENVTPSVIIQECYRPWNQMMAFDLPDKATLSSWWGIIQIANPSVCSGISGWKRGQGHGTRVLKAKTIDLSGQI